MNRASILTLAGVTLTSTPCFAEFDVGKACSSTVLEAALTTELLRDEAQELADFSRIPSVLKTLKLGTKRVGYEVYYAAVATGAIAACMGAEIPTSLELPSLGALKSRLTGNDKDECAPSNATFWNSLQNYKNGIRRSGAGNKANYYKWDYLHKCEVEWYDRNGDHLGSVDGMSGSLIKPAVRGRNIRSEIN